MLTVTLVFLGSQLTGYLSIRAAALTSSSRLGPECKLHSLDEKYPAVLEPRNTTESQALQVCRERFFQRKCFNSAPFVGGEGGSPGKKCYSTALLSSTLFCSTEWEVLDLALVKLLHHTIQTSHKRFVGREKNPEQWLPLLRQEAAASESRAFFGVGGGGGENSSPKLGTSSVIEFSNLELGGILWSDSRANSVIGRILCSGIDGISSTLPWSRVGCFSLAQVSGSGCSFSGRFYPTEKPLFLKGVFLSRLWSQGIIARRIYLTQMESSGQNLSLSL